MTMLSLISSSHTSPWYDWVFFGLGIVMMCPDWALESVRLGLNWRNLIWLEVLSIGGVLLAMIILKRYYPDLHWYFPLIPLGLVAAIRVLAWLINRGDDNL